MIFIQTVDAHGNYKKIGAYTEVNFNDFGWLKDPNAFLFSLDDATQTFVN